MNNLAGQTVVVTGAGAGIGQALALGFVGRGAHVVALGRGRAALDATRARCGGPGTIDCHAVDVTDAPALDALLTRVVRERGGVDVLINGAAVYPRTALRDTDPADWAAGVATNLNGVANGCRALVLAQPADRAAIVLNVGSFAHLGPEPASTLYCATKAAVAAFTRALAVELAAAGSRIVVNEWVPGVYKTQMSGHTGEEVGLAFDRVLAVIAQSRGGPGGRVFERDEERLPARSRLSRLKSMLTGGGR